MSGIWTLDIMKGTCPKCASTNAWFARDRVDVTLRCLCGYNKVIVSMLDVMEDERTEPLTLKLPAKGSNLLKTLLALAELVEANSSQVTAYMNALTLGDIFRQKDVASYLYVLKGKGFVLQTTERKRMAGGGVWRVTIAAQGLL